MKNETLTVCVPEGAATASETCQSTTIEVEAGHVSEFSDGLGSSIDTGQKERWSKNTNFYNYTDEDLSDSVFEQIISGAHDALWTGRNNEYRWVETTVVLTRFEQADASKNSFAITTCAKLATSKALQKL